MVTVVVADMSESVPVYAETGATDFRHHRNGD